MPSRRDDAELAKMLGLTDDEAGGGAAKASTGLSPQTTGHPPMPMGLSRIWLGTIGMFAGLLGGVLLAIVVGSRPLGRVR